MTEKSSDKNLYLFPLHQQQAKSDLDRISSIADDNPFSSVVPNHTNLPSPQEFSPPDRRQKREKQVTSLKAKPTPKSTANKPRSTKKGKKYASNPASHPRNSGRKKKVSLADKKYNPALKPLYPPLLLFLRLSVISVGLSVILGTVFSIANTTHSLLTEEITPPAQATQEVTNSNNEQLNHFASGFILGQELTSLKIKLENLATQYPQLEPGIFLIELDQNGYVSLQGTAPFAAASTIKIPVLVAFFQDVDAGKIRLDEQLTMTEDVIGSGSGDMQYQPAGKEFSVLETATKMMTISDNTATNMLIKRMGGVDALNQRFLEWGLTATVIRNLLPDLEGTNSTSPEDLGNLLAKIDRGELISLRSRDRLLYIMRNVVTNTLLPQGLEDKATIAHKTGDIRSVLGDAGIIDMPSGQRYIASVLVKRPDNDPKAKELIQQISRTIYQHLKWTKPQPFTENIIAE
ncbi:serine hydrolase [Pleurocapsales cyanobacterium LEGE 06147]|nr:serine hydrolase [Pleurocapsales cyanobacterium LEGE 06147]